MFSQQKKGKVVYCSLPVPFESVSEVSVLSWFSILRFTKIEKFNNCTRSQVVSFYFFLHAIGSHNGHQWIGDTNCIGDMHVNFMRIEFLNIVNRDFTSHIGRASVDF